MQAEILEKQSFRDLKMRNETHLLSRSENFRPLTTMDYIDRALRVHPDSQAVIWCEQFWNYRQFGTIVG